MDKNLNNRKSDHRLAPGERHERIMSESMSNEERRKSIVQVCLELGISPEGAWSFSDRSVDNLQASQDAAAGKKPKSSV